LDPRLRARLAEEALGLLRLVAVQELESDAAAQARVPGEEDRAHAAGAELALQAVARPVAQKTQLRGIGDRRLRPGDWLGRLRRADPQRGEQRVDRRLVEAAGGEQKVDPGAPALFFRRC